MVPEPFEIRAQRIDAGGIDLVDAPVADGAIDDQAGALENPEVLRDGGPADRKVARELADRHRAAQQPLDNRPPGGVAERVHLGMWVSVH